MALIPAKMTKKATAIALQGVAQHLHKHLAAHEGVRMRGIASAIAPLSKYDLAAPVEVYTLAFADLNRGLGGAKGSGWRYLVMDGDKAVAAAALDKPLKGSKTGPTFSHLTTGGFVSSSLQALKAAEAVPDVKKEDYQLRLLQIPAASAVALWLHGKSKDLLFPLQTGASNLEDSGTPKCLSPDEFLTPVLERARLLSEFDNTPEASRRLLSAGRKKANARKRKKPDPGSK